MRDASFGVRFLTAPEQDTFHRRGYLVRRGPDAGDFLEQEHRHHQAPCNRISGKTAIEEHEQIEGNGTRFACHGEIGGKGCTEKQGDQMDMPGVKPTKGNGCLPHFWIKLAGRQIAVVVKVPQKCVIRNLEEMAEQTKVSAKHQPAAARRKP